MAPKGATPRSCALAPVESLPHVEVEVAEVVGAALCDVSGATIWRPFDVTLNDQFAFQICRSHAAELRDLLVLALTPDKST